MTPLQSYITLGALVLIGLAAIAVLCATEYQHQMQDKRRQDRWHAVLEETRK